MGIVYQEFPMTELYKKSILKLELDRVLELLAYCAGSADGKSACRDLRPISDADDVKRLFGRNIRSL